jgi:beta-mannanase
MKTYTGLTGKEDTQARGTGKTFFVVEVGPDTLLVFDNEPEADKHLKEESWNSWVAVTADNPDQAVDRFYDAFDQWSEQENML